MVSKLEQEQAYIKYIDNHKQNVIKAWESIKHNLSTINCIKRYEIAFKCGDCLSLIDNLIQTHDSSKTQPEEFEAYRKYFYPVSDEEKENSKEEFDKAWKHHYTNNLHHWNWWYESGNINSMSLPFVIEMICDWMAMGYQFNNTAKDWYYKNKNNIHLGELQEKFVEDFLELI